MEWISVKDEFPDDCGIKVLMVVVDKYGRRKVVKGFTSYSHPIKFFTHEKEFDDNWESWEVTHWMTLPRLPNRGVVMEWISVNDRMPEEKDSIFKKFKGTNKWIPQMFERISEYVNASVEFDNGQRKTYVAYTVDGNWKFIQDIDNVKVTHWMPLPEPPKGE